MPQAKTVFFTSPKQVEIKTTPLPALKADEVLVESICSAISAGSEMLIYRGQFPNLEDAHDKVSSQLKYPLTYGYATVGRVVETGDRVDPSLRNKLVFAFQAHTSHFILRHESLILIPDSISPENACLLPNMETAVNLIQDGAPILGERVLVLGQGIVGLLTASLLAEFPLEKLAALDFHELRRKASSDIEGVHAFDPGVSELRKALLAYAQGKFDLAFELSGSPSALNDAIELTAFSGRIVVGSWYGQKHASIDLGGSFHRSRIQLLSSQVSTIAPALAARWDKSRRFDVTWKALRRVRPEKWITHRFPLEEAGRAYHLLDENPQETIQVIFEYPK
ncbi:MAG: oxidoreductase [Chloroflexi bacterium]|nr:oxidoreductase [Chloroflexota bacterium]